MMNSLIINLNNNKFTKKKINHAKHLGFLDYALYRHNKNKTYNKDPYNPENCLCIGGGPITGTLIPGTYRLIFVAKSPLTKTLFASTLGGAAIELYKAGLEFINITGKAKKPCVIIIKNDGELNARIDYVSNESVNQGTTKFMKSLLNKYKKEFKGLKWRILVAGPAAFNTSIGFIKGVVIKGDEFDWGAEGVAGSGGLGSIMAQAHNVAAIIYGGNRDERIFKKNFKDIKVINELFNRVLGKSMNQSVLKAVEKYLFVKNLGTGGTFGVNMTTLGAWLPMLNWQSVNTSKAVRQRIYDKLVKNHYLKQWNDEIIKPRGFKTCGEACPARCKKVYKNYKKDYEPYESCGPNAGVFDQRHAEALESELEELGYCAIEFGNIISLILEAVSKGLINKEIIGVKEINYDLKKVKLSDSRIHSRAGIKIARMINNGEKPLNVFKQGIRVGVKKLKKDYGINITDLANYIPFGRNGCIAPAEYWVPGFYVPLPMMGKFLTYYGKEFHPPRELGKMSAERFIYELYSENTGICRFHRKWAEKIIPKLINEGLGLNINYYEHCKKLLQGLMNYSAKAKAYPTFYETRRTKDVIINFYKEASKEFGKSPELLKLLDEFKKDPEIALRNYFSEMLKGINDVIKWF